jgi:Putative lumazine-binding
MKFLITSCLLFLILTLNAQQNDNQAFARIIVETFFKGFHQGDTLIMKSVMADKLSIQTAYTNGNGEAQVVDINTEQLLKAIASRPTSQIWEEKLLSFQVQVDGNLAHVWVPYEFWVNEVFSHCGANAFTLGKTEDGWKILHLIDSRRKAGCEN